MFALTFQYQTLFTINTQHHYYKKAKGNVFQYKPTPATEALLKKMNLVCRSEQGNLSVLYDVKSLERIEKYLTENPATCLQFYLTVSEPYFINITEIPTEGIGKIIHLKNQDTKPALSQEASVSQKDIYPVYTNNFIYQNQQKKETHILLKNALGEVIWENKVAPAQKSLVQLKENKAGLYFFYENDKEIEKFIYLVSESVILPLALVEIDFQGELSKQLLSNIRNQENFSPWQFEIQFQARMTYWKYFIIPKYENGLEDLDIEVGKTKVTFKGPLKTQIPNGQRAYLFESVEALHIQQAGQYEFQLVQNKDSKGKKNQRIIQRLPLASLSTLYPQGREQTTKIYSEIYVYL